MRDHYAINVPGRPGERVPFLELPLSLIVLLAEASDEEIAVFTDDEIVASVRERAAIELVIRRLGL